MNSYLQIHTIIKVTYVFNNQEEQVSIDAANSLQVLKNIISLSKKIKFKEYGIYYNNKVIEEGEDSRTIKSIVKSDKSPIFFVFKKNDKNKSSQMDDFYQHKYAYRLKIENFPSKQEIIDKLNTFMQNQLNDYFTEIKQSVIFIIFKSKALAEEFSKILLEEKEVNDLYSKLVIQLVQENSHTFQNLQHTNNTSSLLKITKELNNNASIDATPDEVIIQRNPNSLLFKTKTQLAGNQVHESSGLSNTANRYKQTVNYNNYNKSTNHYSSHMIHKSDIMNKEFVDSIHKNVQFVGISNSYESDFEKNLREYQEGKKKWVSREGFKRFIGSSASILAKPISNYVNLSPYNPANAVEFRTKNKKKWMTDQTFML